MKQLTLEQAIVLTAFTGITVCEFYDFHKAVEEKLGRPVWTHQFGNADFAAELKELYREDFFKLIPQAKIEECPL